ncbi:hypothetical protein JYG23_13930 [Sedimentibacter sp. zth1]|uniref:hypothetical protein n=1 Tax=Sedimentibacter sp. zth1 TaxID=2816908 RepID=UPI001A915020|nr:hypothetical protein [Sedimentibacter sp. zth1]QSX05744.1 hypothetical protein JYG23_13930 [Sedimentibacter sp. zth1]
MKYKNSNYIHILICFCLLTIAMTVFMLSNKNYNKVEHKIIDFDNKNVESTYLRVNDVYGQDNQKSLSEFFAEKDALKRMKQFCSILNEEFNYLEFDKQSLVIQSVFNYKDEFRIDYGSKYFGENDNIGISLKSVQIGKNAYDEFNLENQLADGRGFEPKDFIFDNNKTVSAIFGHEYSELINIGDTINFEYLSKDISVTVIGFFEKDTLVTLNNNIFFLDRYITIPSLDMDFIPLNKDDERFQKILYSLKNWGYIKVNDGEDYYDYKNRIDDVSKALDLKYVVNEAYIYKYIKNISNTINSSKGIFLIASIILLLILSAIFAYIYIWNYNKNKKIYAIHLICGCNFLRMKLKIFFEIFIQFILSLGIAGLVNRLLLGHNSIYVSDRILLNKAISQTTRFSFIIMLVICLVLNIYINKSNIYSSIRKEN